MKASANQSGGRREHRIGDKASLIALSQYDPFFPHQTARWGW